MSELRNQDTTKDFSIFADKEESLVNSDSKPKGSKKYNEDGSLFVYPNSADSSLDNKRKPFQELAIRSASPASESIDIDFEPPIMASTCNFKQLRDQAKGKRDVEFEPTASSTCNFKNLKANSEKEREHERFLETILDTTDTETDENSSESIEKEKMFNKFLGNDSIIWLISYSGVILEVFDLKKDDFSCNQIDFFTRKKSCEFRLILVKKSHQNN
jgi:hypothetical protein